MAALSRPKIETFAVVISVGHRDLCKSGSRGNFLGSIHRVGDDATRNRAADLLTPQFLAIGGIQRIEVAAHIAEKHDASGGWGHTALDRIVGFQPPLPGARVGIDCVDPSSPISERVGLAPDVIGVAACLAAPWACRLQSPEFVF